MYRYHLSNRQIKELANGKRLRIALPYPDEGIPGARVHHDLCFEADPDPAALTRWAAGMLRVAEKTVCQAEVVLVPVDPKWRSDGLSKLLGSPLHATSTAGWRVRVLCVVVDLAQRLRPRSDYPTQWPKCVEIDGRTYPESDA